VFVPLNAGGALKLSVTVRVDGWKPWEEANFHADGYSDEVVVFLYVSSPVLSTADDAMFFSFLANTFAICRRPSVCLSSVVCL